MFPWISDASCNVQVSVEDFTRFTTGSCVLCSSRCLVIFQISPGYWWFCFALCQFCPDSRCSIMFCGKYWRLFRHSIESWHFLFCHSKCRSILQASTGFWCLCGVAGFGDFSRFLRFKDTYIRVVAFPRGISRPLQVSTGFWWFPLGHGMCWRSPGFQGFLALSFLLWWVLSASPGFNVLLRASTCFWCCVFVAVNIGGFSMIPGVPHQCFPLCYPLLSMVLPLCCGECWIILQAVCCGKHYGFFLSAKASWCFLLIVANIGGFFERPYKLLFWGM